jgi:lipid-A-disaccharide synthase-like uncharacterized protein
MPAMEFLAQVVGSTRLIGIDWHFWKVVGWAGNVIFFSRFFVQWYATEKSKQVVVPNSFWWLSLVGSLCLLAYGLWRRDSVFIFAYAFTWIPYIRNLVISRRAARQCATCASCSTDAPPGANYCPNCGLKLAAA